MRTASLGGEAVERVVALTLGPNLAAEREGGRGREGATVLVDVSDADLDGRVVLGGDETVWAKRGE